jgi:hypothetical protein
MVHKFLLIVAANAGAFNPGIELINCRSWIPNEFTPPFRTFTPP